MRRNSVLEELRVSRLGYLYDRTAHGVRCNSTTVQVATCNATVGLQALYNNLTKGKTKLFVILCGMVLGISTTIQVLAHVVCGN